VEINILGTVFKVTMGGEGTVTPPPEEPPAVVSEVPASTQPIATEKEG
jgi:hypothetical protein